MLILPTDFAVAIYTNFIKINDDAYFSNVTVRTVSKSDF